MSRRKRGSSTEKRCAACQQVKPRTDEHWYFTESRGGPRIDSYCKECRKRYREAKPVKWVDPDQAVKKIRENQISTRYLFEVIAKVKGPAEATRIVNEERAAQGLPPMDYVGDLDIVAEDVEAFSINF